MKTYLRHRVSNVVDVKELIALEHLDFEGKYKGYSEKHDFWEFCYVEKGEITLTVDGAKHTLSSNELFVIPPNSIRRKYPATICRPCKKNVFLKANQVVGAW